MIINIIKSEVINMDLKKLQKFSKNLHILYVEDNETTRDITNNLLKELFDSITMAVDGEDGLNKFKHGSFDLIISDINMPNMNGIEMVKEIRELDTNIPILITSAYSESKYFMETIKLGVEGYLLKPIEFKQFLSIVGKVIEKIKLQHDLKEYQNNLEKKVQEQLAEITEKNNYIQAREKFAAMGEMIDAIAHQFRQPIGIIKLQAQELEYLTKEYGCTNQEIEDTINGIIKQVGHAVETIDEFRKFFREDVDRKKVTIQSVFDSLLTLIKDELIKYTINVNIDGDTSIKVNIIPNEFKHVLLNLVNNAKDVFIEKNIKDGNITLSVIEEDDCIIVGVEDNGGGIPESIFDKIFEANFTTKGIDRGTGIGLHISKMILEKIETTIDVENINLGAKFRIKIPKSV